MQLDSKQVKELDGLVRDSFATLDPTLISNLGRKLRRLNQNGYDTHHYSSAYDIIRRSHLGIYQDIDALDK